MKKSVFLSLVTMFMIGGSVLASSNSLRVATANLSEGGSSCLHEQRAYESLGSNHSVNCIECRENLGTEAHVDENNDMCCDACGETLSSLAPSQGEGYVESELTLKESIKISIKANKNEVSKIIVSSWYDIDDKNVYETEAFYNTETELYETEIRFADVNGKNGIYNFDASIYDAEGNMRYVRISEVEYTKNGISKVSTNRTPDGNIEVEIKAVEGGEIYIATNDEVPTENSKWQEYNSGETYSVEDENNEVNKINVYYRSAGVMTVAEPTAALAITGSIKIVGTNMVGEELSVDTSGISPTGCDYTYAWYYTNYLWIYPIRVDIGTGETCILTADELNQTIYVEVTASKDGYIAETFTDKTDVTNNTSATVKKNNGYVELNEETGAIEYGTASTSFVVADHHGGNLSVSTTKGTATVNGTTITVNGLGSVSVGTTVTVTVTSSATTTHTAATATYTITIIEDPNAIGGSVTIEGTLKVGEILTANTSEITPEGCSFSYQWYRASSLSGIGTLISDAIEETYTLTSNEVNKYIYVVVTVTNSEGDVKDITSSRKGPIRAATASSMTGSVQIVGTNTVGQTLSVDTSGINPTGCELTYTWYYKTTTYWWLFQSRKVEIGTGATLTLTADELNKTIYVDVTAIKNGYVTTTFTDQTDATNNTSGTVQKGSGFIILQSPSGEIIEGTASTSFQIAEHHGGNLSVSTTKGNASVSGTTVTISGLGSVEVGTIITVTVTSAATSTHTMASETYILIIAEDPFKIEGEVIIEGTLKEGETLTANTDGIMPEDCSFKFQWYVASSRYTTYQGTPISGATSKEFTLTNAQVNKYIYVIVEAKNSEGKTKMITSARKGPIAAITALQMSGSVKITGTNKVGETLSVNISGINPTECEEYTYKWYYKTTMWWWWWTRDIEIGTGETLTLTANELNKTIYVDVTASKSGYVTKTFTDATDKTNNTSATVQKGAGYIVLDTTSGEVKYGTPSISFTVKEHHGGTLKASSTKGIASVSGKTVTVIGLGTVAVGTKVTVTVTSAATTAHTQASTTYTLTILSLGSVDGTVEITGPVKYQQTLSVDTSGVVPEGCSYTYQWWYSSTPGATSGTNITGATKSTYTITNASTIDKYIGVRVVASKGGYTSKTITAITSGTVQKLDGYVNLKTTTGGITEGTDSISFTVLSHHGGTLTANSTSGTAKVTTNYWGTTVTVSGLRNLTPETIVTITVTSGATSTYAEANADYILTILNAPEEIEGSVQIEGVNQFNQTLSVDVSKIMPTDCELTYEWWYYEPATWFGGSPTRTSLGTDQTYTITNSDLVGKVIYVDVTAQKDGYITKTFTDETDVTYNIVATVQKADGYITLSEPQDINYGTASTSFTVTSHHGGILSQSVNLTSLKYYVKNSNGTITVSNLSKLAVGTEVIVTVTSAATATHTAASATYTFTILSLGDVDLTATIEGTAVYGNTLTAVTSGVTPTGCSFTYQWWYANSETGTDATYLASGQSYKIANADAVGKYIGVTVLASKAGYTSKTVTAVMNEKVEKAKGYVNLASQTGEVLEGTASATYTVSSHHGGTLSAIPSISTVTTKVGTKAYNGTTPITVSGLENFVAVTTIEIEVVSEETQTHTIGAATYTLTIPKKIGGSVTINATNGTVIGNKLTVDTSAIKPTDCNLEYQWWYATRSTATSGTIIEGATSGEYIIADTLADKYIGVTVKASKLDYEGATLTDTIGTVQRKTGYINLSETTGSIEFGTATKNFTIVDHHGGNLTATTTGGVTATINGETVTISGLENVETTQVTVTVTSAQTQTHKSASAIYTLNINGMGTITGTIKIDGEAKYGEELKINVEEIVPTGCEFTYRWYYNKKSGWFTQPEELGTGETYTILDSAIIGNVIYVDVIAKKTGYVTNNFTANTATVQTGDGYVKLSEEEGSIEYGTASKTFTVKESHGGTLSVEETTDTVAEVSIDTNTKTITISNTQSLEVGTVVTVKVTAAATRVSTTTTYTAATAQYTLTITKKSISGLTITLPEEDYTYDGEEKRPEVTVKDGEITLVSGDEYTLEYVDNINAGTAKVIVTGIGNYIGSVEKTFIINKDDITPTIIMANYQYRGTVSVPRVTGNLGNAAVTYYYYKTGEQEKEWTGITSTTLAVGEYNMYAIVRESINYNGAKTDELTFNVTPAVITLGVELSGDEYTYDGEAKTPEVIVKDEKITLVSGEDYTVEYKDNIEAGTAKVIVTGIENYAGNTEETTFKINPAIIIIPTGKELTYNGAEQIGVEAGDGYTIEGNKATNVGNYNAKARLESTINYKWSDDTTAEKVIPWVIKAKSSSTLTITLNTTEYEYDERAKEPAVTVKDGEELVAETNYTVTYENNINAGQNTAKVIVTFKENYEGTEEITFTINKGNITPVVTMSDYNYGGIVSTPSVTGNNENGNVTYYYYKTGEEAKEWTGITSTSLEVGTYNMYAVVSETANYNGKTSAVITFNINPATGITLNVTVTPDVYTYDGNAKEPEVTVKVGDEALTSGDEYTFTYVDNKDAGTAKVVVTGQGNYEGNTAEAKFTINPIVVAVPEGKTLTYNGTEQTGVDESPSYIIESNKATNAGNYYAKARLESTINYKWSDDTTAEKVIPWVIKEKISTGLTITLTNEIYTYDGIAKEPEVNVKDGNAIVATSNYTVAYSNNTNASTSENKAKAIITFKENYSGTEERTFTIQKAPAILSLKPTSVEMKVDKQGTSEVSYTGDGTLSATSNDENIATATINEKQIIITGKKVGSTTISILATQGNNYNAISKDISITVVDNAGPNISILNNETEITTDPEFVTSNNGLMVYNSLNNGTVTHSRVKDTTAPNNSGYVLNVKTTGAADPHHGGITWKHQTAANETYLVKIVAKIPEGFNLRWYGGSVGNERTTKTLVPTDGTGDWKTYLFYLRTGSEGTFGKINSFVISGDATATEESPVEWSIAHASVYKGSIVDWTNQNIVITGETSDQAGIEAYAFTTENVEPSEWIQVTETTSNITANYTSTKNGSVYFWAKDKLGNISKTATYVERIDKEAPVITSITKSHVGYSNGDVFLLLNATDDISGVSGVAKSAFGYQYCTNFEEITPSTEVSNYKIATIQFNRSEYNIVIKDQAGNTAQTTIEISTLDKTAPILTNEITHTAQEYYENAEKGVKLDTKATFPSNPSSYKGGLREIVSINDGIVNSNEVVKITHQAGETTSGWARTKYYMNSKVYVRKILAKIPTGYSLKILGNKVDGRRTDITTFEGTGEWKEYSYVFAVTDDAKNTMDYGHAYITGPAATSEFDWYVASDMIYDVTHIFNDVKVTYNGSNAVMTITAKDSQSGTDSISVNGVEQTLITSGINKVVDYVVTNPGSYEINSKDAIGNETPTLIKTAYKITYNGNGATEGTTSNQIKIDGADITINTNGFTRTNYLFAGWNTKADGTGTSYEEGATYTGDENVTLYAQWSLRIVWDVSKTEGVDNVLAILTDSNRDGNYTLTITGSGDMINLTTYLSNQDDKKWYAYRNNITEVVIEEGVTSVGDRVFHGLKLITSIELPSTLTYIGTYSFYACENLTSDILIPKTVTKIGNNPFLHVPTKKIEVEEGNKYYTSIGGILYKLYNNDVTELISYPYGKTDETYIVPETVNKINKDACGRIKAKNVVLPESLKTIEQYAFSESEITKIVIPKNVERIETNTFNGSSSLENVYIETNKLVTLHDNSFGNLKVGSIIYTPSVKIADLFATNSKHTPANTTIYYPPVITMQPSSNKVYCGNRATFEITATDGLPEGITYRWEYRTSDSETWKEVTEAQGIEYDTATFTTIATTMDMNGYQYRCVIGSEAYPNEEMTEEELASSLISETVNLIVIEEEKEMITEWTIPNENTTIILPVTGAVDLYVDWGDETEIQIISGDYPTHKYTTAGDYKIKIFGKIDTWGLNNVYKNAENETIDIPTDSPYYTQAMYLTRLERWGELGATRYGFAYCENLEYVSGDVTDKTFEKVTTMEFMFYNCSNLTTLDTSEFKTGTVESMHGMFYNCSKLTYIDVDKFDTTNVTKMNHMFFGCSSLTTLDVSGFVTDKVTTMKSMFNACSKLTTIAVDNFNTSKVTDMSYMFRDCSSLTTLDVSGFVTKNVTTMQSMFYNCCSLKTLDLDNWDTSKVTDMSYMFAGYQTTMQLESLDLSKWNTVNVKTMRTMFQNCQNLTTLNLSNWNTKKVTDMGYMFFNCSKLTQLDVSSFNTAFVTDMHQMFANCSKLTTLDLSNFNTQSVTDIGLLMYGCSSLNSIQVSNNFKIPTSNYSNMFSSTGNLKSIIITSTNPSGDQFARVKTRLNGKTFYVPNESEEEYEQAFKDSFLEDRVEPILTLSKGDEVLLKGATHTDATVKVAGFEEDKSEYYTCYRYNVSKSGEVNTKEEGTYPIEYTLTRTYESGDALFSTNANGEVIVDKSQIEKVTYTVAKEDRTVTVEQGNYTVNNVDYQKLEEAYNAIKKAGKTGEISVNKDVIDESEFTVDSTYSVTINLNGNTITKTTKGIVNEGTLTISGDGIIQTEDAKDNVVNTLVNNDGTLNVNSSTLINKGHVSKYWYAVYNRGTVNVNGGTLKTTLTDGVAVQYGTRTIQVTASGILNMNSGSIFNEYKGENSIAIESDTSDVAEINIQDGIIKSEYVGIRLLSSGAGNCKTKLYMSSGEIDSGYKSIMTMVSYDGSINITGGKIIAKNDAVSNMGTGSLTIGVSGDSVSTTSPEIISSRSAIITANGFEFYDGILKGSTGAISGPNPSTEPGYAVYTENSGKTAYLKREIVDVALTQSTYTFDGEPKEPTVTVTWNNTPLTVGTDYTVNYSNNTNAGENTAKVTVIGSGDYMGTVEKTFTINKANITPVVSMNDYNYGGAVSTPSISGNIGSGEVTYYYYPNLPEQTNQKWENITNTTLNVGSYCMYAVVAGTDNSNAATSNLVVFNVKPATGITLNVTVTPDVYTYDGSPKTPTVTVEVGETPLVSGDDYTFTYVDNTEAGTAKVLVTGQGKYAGNTTEATFTIAKTTGAVSIEINGETKVGKTLTANVTNESDGKLTYQWWYTTDKNATFGTPIIGETASTYTVTEEMSGRYIGVTVNVSEGTNYLACDGSAKVLIEAMYIYGSINILGKAEYGETLTVDTSLVTPKGCSFKYQWYYNDENSIVGGIPIEGAKEDELELVKGLIGKYVYVEVTAEKEFHTSTTFKDITDTENNTSEVVYNQPTVIDLHASSGESFTEITLTWTHEQDVRYELYFVNPSGDFELLDNSAISPYKHQVKSKNSSFEYFIYGYKEIDPAYRAEGTSKGSTAFDAIYDEIIKDTTKPVISKDSVSATSEIIGSNSTVTVIFEATDLHYDYENSLESGDIEILVDENKIENISGELTKEKIASGERFTYVVTNITGNGTLAIRIPAGVIYDLATNTNDEYVMATNIEVNQGNITRTAPILEEDMKEIKVTNTQISLLEIAKIIYEYRVSGDSEFIKWVETTDGEVTITGLKPNTSYEVRTTVIDIAENKETSLIAITTTKIIDLSVIEITQNPINWTNQDVDVTVKWNDTTYIHEYSTNNIDWNIANAPETKITYTENGTLYIRFAYDDKYSDVVVYEVSNIDKIKPVIGTIIVPEEKANTTYIEVKDIVDEGGSGLKAYYISTEANLTNATWIELTETSFIYNVTENDTYYIFVKDNAGNISEENEVIIDSIEDKVTNIQFPSELEVDVFEKVKPKLTYSGEAKDVVYEIENTDIADINESTGEITGKIAGNTVIKVTIINYDGTEQKATCILIVNRIEPTLSIENDTINLVYGDIESEVEYTYSGDSKLYLSVSGELLIGAYVDEENNKIIVNPIKAGTTTLVIKTLATEIYQSKEFYINIVVEKRTVTLEWTTSTFEYDGTEKEIIANVIDALEGDYVKVVTYENNRKTTSGTFIAKALTLNNSNYTLEGSSNIEKEWRIQRGVVDLDIRMKDYSYGGKMQNPYVRNNPDNRAIDYYYNTVSLNESGTPWEEVTDSTSLPVGTYYVYAVARETANYYETITEPVKFNVLPTELEVKLMQYRLEYNGEWTKDTVYVQIDISGDANVTAYQYKEENGDDWIDVLGSIIPIETEMNSKLIFRGINPAGKEVTLETTTDVIKIDTTAPNIKNVTQETVNKMVEINIEAVDTLSGITSYAIVANENAQREWKNISKIQDGIIEIKVAGTGTYYIYLKDAVGNISEKQTLKVVKDIIAPTGEITVLDAYLIEDNIAYTNKMQVILGITATDNVSESGDIQMAICREEYYNSLTNEDQIVWESYAETKEWTLQKENADEIVYLILKDKAGNITEKSLVVSN